MFQTCEISNLEDQKLAQLKDKKQNSFLKKRKQKVDKLSQRYSTVFTYYITYYSISKLLGNYVGLLGIRKKNYYILF